MVGGNAAVNTISKYWYSEKRNIYSVSELQRVFALVLVLNHTRQLVFVTVRCKHNH